MFTLGVLTVGVEAGLDGESSLGSASRLITFTVSKVPLEML